MIAIVDYGMGNLRSVEKGFLHVGVEAQVVSDSRSVDDAAAIVLPGVGAFRDCMRNLSDLGLTKAILKGLQQGKPYLGICLGLQVLFSESEEFGHTRGLNVFKGKVPRFPERQDFKVPHMGWNSVEIKRRPPIFEGIPEASYFYFVHSYYVAPDDPGIVAATSNYGVDFTCMVWKDHIMATQFHPEKSQRLGLRVLRNFGDFVRRA